MCSLVLTLGRLLIVVVFFAVNRGAKVVDLTSLSCTMCKEPQPRAVVVAQEVDIFEDTVPYMTILHRCDAGSGCCTGRGTICKVINFETINATIYVRDLTTQRYSKKNFEITNHTECACQNGSNIPK